MTDESGVLIVHPSQTRYIGSPIADLRTLDGQEIGKEMAAATEQGLWTTFVVPLSRRIGDGVRPYVEHPLRRPALQLLLLRRPPPSPQHPLTPPVQAA